MKEKKKQRKLSLPPETPNVLICIKRGTSAKGIKTENGFVVLAGSSISPTLAEHASKYKIDELRAKYADKIVDFILQEDIMFNSSSQAAGFVCGASQNGNDAWK